MEKKINLIDQIFIGRFFIDNYKYVDSGFISFNDYIDLVSDKELYISELLNDKLMCTSFDKGLFTSIETFLSAIVLTSNKLDFKKLNNYNIEINGYYIKADKISFFIPLSLLRKLVFILSKKDIFKFDKSKYSEVLQNLIDDFLIKSAGFPYRIDDFINSLDDIELQNLFNLLFSSGMLGETMLMSIITSKNMDRILSNVSKRSSANVRNLINNNEYDENQIALLKFQFKINLGLLGDKIKHKGLRIYHKIQSIIYADEIDTFLEGNDINVIFNNWREKEVLFKLFSQTSNSEIAKLLKTEYREIFSNYCSKRRLEMIKEEKNYIDKIEDYEVLLSLSNFIYKGYELEFSSIQNKTRVFSTYLRSINGEKDFDVIFSRMNPIEFALCFKNLNMKVKKYVINKVSSPGCHYLLGFFENKIHTSSHINKGWIKSSRENFSKLAFILSRIGKITLKEIEQS